MSVLVTSTLMNDASKEAQPAHKVILKLVS